MGATVNAESPSEEMRIENETAETSASPVVNTESKSASCPDNGMNQIKQDAINRVQQARNEKEVREEYQDFLKQAKQEKNHPAHKSPCVQSNKGVVQTRNASRQRTSRQFVAKSPAVKKTHKPATKIRRKKPVKKQEQKNHENEVKEKKNVCPAQESSQNKHGNGNRSANDPFPALILISSFLSYALVKLSTIGRSTSTSVTFIELNSSRR